MALVPALTNLWGYSAPTVATIVAALPTCWGSDIAIPTCPLYPDPNVPVDPIPIEVIAPAAFTVVVTDAPTRGA